MKQALVVGCGLSGAVIARELAENGYKVKILEKRNHIGGNMYDYKDDYGILVHKYGPHTFHTKKKELYEYMCRYADWEEYQLTCGAEIDGITTPTPFNYKTIDDFYRFDEANELKRQIEETFPGRDYATVVETLNCGNKMVSDYAQFLFDKDYSLYSAKQWGCKPSEIDPSILKRVPLRFNYNEGYFDDEYQMMPKISFTDFFENILNHDNIEIQLNVDALDHIKIVEGEVYIDGIKTIYPVIYSGPLDELFGCKYGKLPYRSLHFEWKHEKTDSFQKYPVVAYPQAEGFVRIIEYNKLPVQNTKGTTYEVEYSLPYKQGENNEPYYPLLTEESQKNYIKYDNEALNIRNLYICGRLGDFKYYNMDQALERALEIKNRVLEDALKEGIYGK